MVAAHRFWRRTRVHAKARLRQIGSRGLSAADTARPEIGDERVAVANLAQTCLPIRGGVEHDGTARKCLCPMQQRGEGAGGDWFVNRWEQSADVSADAWTSPNAAVGVSSNPS